MFQMFLDENNLILYWNLSILITQKSHFITIKVSSIQNIRYFQLKIPKYVGLGRGVRGG